jgi:hypothetical protein
VLTGVLAAVVAAAVVALLVAVGLAVLYGITVVPFLLTVDLAERRGCSTGRWAGWSLVAVLLALALVAVGLLSGRRACCSCPRWAWRSCRWPCWRCGRRRSAAARGGTSRPSEPATSC